MFLPLSSLRTLTFVSSSSISNHSATLSWSFSAFLYHQLEILRYFSLFFLLLLLLLCSCVSSTWWWWQRQKRRSWMELRGEIRSKEVKKKLDTEIMSQIDFQSHSFGFSPHNGYFTWFIFCFSLFLFISILSLPTRLLDFSFDKIYKEYWDTLDSSRYMNGWMAQLKSKCERVYVSLSFLPSTCDTLLNSDWKLPIKH